MKKRKTDKKRIPRPKRKYKDESHVVRLSPELFFHLKKMCRRQESYDNIIRRVLGMPVTRYAEYAAQLLFGIEDGSHLFQSEDVARGEAIRLAVRKGQKKPPPIIKLRTAI